jgi:hypothetical protein
MRTWLIVVAACSPILLAPTDFQTGCPRPPTISVNDWNAMSADAQDAACGGGQSAPKMSLEAHIQQWTGPEAVDCGTHRGGSNPEAMLQSLACAREAADQHMPFQVIQRCHGDDSEIAVGVLLNAMDRRAGSTTTAPPTAGRAVGNDS